MIFRTSGFYSDQLTLDWRDLWHLLRGIELQVGGLRVRFGHRQATEPGTDGRWLAPTKRVIFNHDGARVEPLAK